MIATCIQTRCGQRFDASRPELRDITLRAYGMRYCPEHRANAMTWRHILIAAREAGGDRDALYRVWCYLRDEEDGQ